jgi:hypothetical protein
MFSGGAAALGQAWSHKRLRAFVEDCGQERVEGSAWVPSSSLKHTPPLGSFQKASPTVVGR